MSFDNGSAQSNADVGVRHFLNDVIFKAGCGVDLAIGVVAALSSRGDECGGTSARAALDRAFRDWHREALDSYRSPLTANCYGDAAARVLDRLGSLYPTKYPQLARSSFSFASLPGNVVTLGSLNWPEIATVADPLDRDEAALNILVSHSVALYNREFELFRFGQSVLSGETLSGADRSAQAHVRRALVVLRSTIACQASGNVSGVDFWSELDRDDAEAVLHPSTWERAGLPIAYAWPLSLAGCKVTNLMSYLLLPGLGPTSRMTLLLAKAYAGLTGWNLQPILDLSDRPFLYRRPGAAFLGAFKNRAGHDVYAKLAAENPPATVKDAQVLWDIAAEEGQIETEWSASAVLGDDMPDGGGNFLAVFERHEAVTAAIRDLDRANEFSHRYFPWLTKRGVALDPATFASRSPITDHARFAPFRKGATFRAIRKTFIKLKGPEAGSVDGLKVLSGNRNAAVMVRHYLNDPIMRSQREASIRLVQNTVEAHLSEAFDAGHVDVLMSQDDRDWFLRLSPLSGISSALGMVIEPAGAAMPLLRFVPTPDNLLDLYTLHLALVQARHVVGMRRWFIQARPLLRLTKAIGRALVSKHFRDAYRSAACKGNEDLRAGAITLPTVLED